MKMRRKEREVTDSIEIKSVIDKCEIMRVAFNDDGHIYVVPVNFGYKEENGKYTFYFHGARDGRKFGLVQKGGLAGFECDCDYQLVRAEEACNHTALYSSIIGEGIVSEIQDKEEKKSALSAFMLKVTGKGDWNFPSIMLAKVGVFKIEVTEMSCKAHKQ